MNSGNQQLHPNGRRHDSNKQWRLEVCTLLWMSGSAKSEQCRATVCRELATLARPSQCGDRRASMCLARFALQQP
eukprot:3390588-Amphidinium_carterae.2